jgi:CheY-like chemotaxis protein/HPt (histidine-containing phosphotransfer) domain-containing protein
MLTSVGLRDSASKATKFAAYLTKPIKPALLYSKVLEVFGGRPPGPARPQTFDMPALQARLGMYEPLRLLLAEDIVVNQKVALLLLDRIGYKADVVGNGYEVLEALRRQPYDVILMDIQMPEMDGLETTRRVRSGEWLEAHENDAFERQPFIIAMTANAMQGDRENYLTAGMDDYISKPVRVEELTRALKAAYAARHANQAAAPDGQKVETPPHSRPDPLAKSEYDRFIGSIGAENGAAIASLIHDYLDESPRVMEQFRQAVAARDARRIRVSMHSLQSSSKLFGAARLADLCRTLESAAQDNPDYFTAEVVSSVESEYVQVVAALRIKLKAE